MHFLGLFQIEIAGILFLFPPELRRKANGGTLYLGEKTLVLLNSEGRVVAPREDLLSSWKPSASETERNGGKWSFRIAFIVAIPLLFLLVIWYVVTKNLFML